MEYVEEAIELHDNFQFEIKFTYPLEKKEPFTSYNVETFMFIPNNLCINSMTYTKENFYNDMQKYIRLKTPVMLLKNILSEKDSPLKALKDAIKTLMLNPKDEKYIADYKYHLKMLCSIFKSALRDETNFIAKIYKKDESGQYIKNVLSNSEEIVHKFREMKDLINVPLAGDRNYALFLFADEFLSLTLEKYRYRFIFLIDKSDSVKGKKKVKSDILEDIEKELKYREASKYPSVPDEKSDNEELLYRESTLKKIMGSVLFLKTHVKKEGFLIEQIFLGLGAGLAMAFATAVAFASQFRIENLTISLFMILVISYIFKDRMKEWSRLFFYSKVQQKYLYDRKTNIYSSLNNIIGYCKERFSFCKEKELPSIVNRIRNKDYITELDNGYIGEDVIYSEKLIKIYSDKCRNLLEDFNVDGINDMLRFNIKNFLRKMDNPEKVLYIPDNSEVKEIKGSRAYHINLIIKYGMLKKQDIYKHFKIILNRNGIKRIIEIPITI